MPMQIEVKNKLTQKGFSLIELSIVLLILGLLVAGVIGASTMSINTTERHNAVIALDSLKVTASKFSQGTDGYGTEAFTSLIVASEQVPGTFTVKGAEIVHNLDPLGRITFMGFGPLFSMTVTNLTNADCIDILSASGSLYERVSFDSNNNPTNANVYGTATPLSTSDINSVCTGENNINLHLVSR